MRKVLACFALFALAVLPVKSAVCTAQQTGHCINVCIPLARTVGDKAWGVSCASGPKMNWLSLTWETHIDCECQTIGASSPVPEMQPANCGPQCPWCDITCIDRGVNPDGGLVWGDQFIHYGMHQEAPPEEEY